MYYILPLELFAYLLEMLNKYYTTNTLCLLDPLDTMHSWHQDFYLPIAKTVPLNQEFAQMLLSTPLLCWEQYYVDVVHLLFGPHKVVISMPLVKE